MAHHSVSVPRQVFSTKYSLTLPTQTLLYIENVMQEVSCIPTMVRPGYKAHKFCMTIFDSMISARRNGRQVWIYLLKST